MGSMDTSRIGQFLGLTPKLASAGDDATARSGGFADMLLGVMTKRVSTAQPPLSTAKVSTVLPLNEHAGGVQKPAPDRPHRQDRNVEAAGKSGESGPNAMRPAGEKIAAAHKQDSAAKPDDRCGTGEVTETAPTVETGDIAEEPGEEIDLQGESESTEGQDATAQQDGGEQSAGQNPDPQAQAAAIEPQIVVTTAAAATDASLAVDGVAASPASGTVPGDTGEPAAPQAAAPTAAQPQAQPETAAPQVGIPQPALPGSHPEQTEDGIQMIGAGTASEAEKAAAEAAARAIDAALGLTGEDVGGEAGVQTGLPARQSERRGEDQPGDFRRSATTSRQRNAATGSGTAANSSAPAANAQAATVSGAKTTAPAGAATTTILPLNPLGLDTGLGQMTGLPGWTMNLAQGNAARRPEFVAQLRQHLQNLPVHEQVALGIQRTARDGGGRITLELAPAELGRIHVKLDIDEENNARAAVSVERPATLDLLQKDAKALERALQDAGLKMDQGALSLSLQGGDTESFAREFGTGGNDLAQFMSDGGEDDLPPEMAPAAVIATGEGMVDVQV